jgi:FkbM family methyltransferase
VSVTLANARVRRQLGRLRADFPGEVEALARRGVWRVAARFTPVLAVDREGLRLYVSTDDQVLGRRLFVYNRAPETDIQLTFNALRQIPGIAGRLNDFKVLEIGANIGSHTVALLKHYGASEVIAIEPSPANCDLVRQNALSNSVSERVQLLELALSDQDGSVSLEISPSNSGDHRVRVSGGATNGAEASRDTIDVRAARLDSLVETGEVDLDSVGLVWLDAQGHEGHIFSGARRLLGSEIPIAMEYWPYGLRRAGGLQLLHELIAEHYSHVLDIAPPDGSGPRVVPAAELPRLESEYGWDRSEEQDLGTDLILSTSLQA